MKKTIALVSVGLVITFFTGYYMLNYLPIFTIGKFVIEKSEFLDSQTLADFLEHFVGMPIHKVSKSDIREIAKRFSRVKRIKIRRGILGTITLAVDEEIEDFYIKDRGSSFIPITKEKKVLDFDYLKDIPMIDIGFKKFSKSDSATTELVESVVELHSEIEKIDISFSERISEYYQKDGFLNIVITAPNDVAYRVVLGEGDVEQFVKRIFFIERNFNLQNKTLDLRYSNQVIYRDGDYEKE